MASVEPAAIPTDDRLRSELKSFIVEHLGLKDVDPGAIGDHEPLVGGALELDSIDVLELVTGVEKRYGIRVEDPDVVARAFASVSSLASHIAAHRGGR